MKTFAITALAVALMSGSAMALPAKGAAYGNGPFYGKAPLVKTFRGPVLTYAERMQIARSQHNLNLLEWRIHRDGRVTAWERIQVRFAQSRHNALVYRLSHN